MFGERYFATRERLTAAVHGVKDLARDTGTDLGPLADTSPEGFLSGLKDPVLFLVCGEVNAGKSAFFNGLFGHELCPSQVLPETKTLQWFRYGKKDRDEIGEELLETRYRNVTSLRDFNLIDTPGTNSSNRDHLSQTESFLSLVDIIFCVFPVSNPWGASTWDFIARFPEEFHSKLVIILQQKDTCDAKDIAVMVGHMRDLAVHKIGRAPDVFPVSASLALQAKGGENLNHRLWRESGYAELEAHITQMINQSTLRREVMRGIVAGASQVLRDIEDRMEARRRTLDADQGFLREIELEVEKEREKHGQGFGEKFSGLGEVFGEQATKAALLLRERTSIAPSLWSIFKKDQTPAEIEKGLIEAVEKAVAQRASEDSDELVETCHAHWRTVVPRVESRLEMPAPDFEQDSGDFDGSKERFAKRLSRAARSAVVQLKLRILLDGQLEKRRDLLRRYVIGALVAITVGAILGTFGHHLFAGLGFLTSLLVLLVGLWKAHRSSRELIAYFEEKASLSRDPFAEALSSDYQEGVRSFFVEYAMLFEGIRRHVATLKMRLKPQLDAWHELFLEVRAIEQEI